MKKLGLLFTLFSLFILSAQAEQWYGYCHFQKNSETVCSGIKQRTPDFDDYCKSFALSLGANAWKMQYATSVKMLQDMQADKCDKVLAGPASQQHACYVTTYCQGSGGPTSSITPINLSVVAGNKTEALNQCLIQGKDIYYNYFKNNSKSNCFTKADVQ